jgi:hypothetical protein
MEIVWGWAKKRKGLLGRMEFEVPVVVDSIVLFYIYFYF